MKAESELPEDVLAAISANRKIEAIKLLRDHRNIGLKEARRIVDDYAAGHPSPMFPDPARADSGVGRLVLICVAGFLAYAAYQFLT